MCCKTSSGLDGEGTGQAVQCAGLGYAGLGWTVLGWAEQSWARVATNRVEASRETAEEASFEEVETRHRQPTVHRTCLGLLVGAAEEERWPTLAALTYSDAVHDLHPSTEGRVSRPSVT